eukprot:scaffold34688_cov234-Amphora_coffeaeformis.AAC.4
MGNDLSVPEPSESTGVPSQVIADLPNAASASFSVASKKTKSGTPRSSKKLNVALLHETLGNSSISSRKNKYRVKTDDNSILAKGDGSTTATAPTPKHMNFAILGACKEGKEVETNQDTKAQKTYAKERDVEVLFESKSDELLDLFAAKLKFADGSSVAEMSNNSAYTASLLSDQSCLTDVAQCPGGDEATASSRERRLYFRRMYEEQQAVQKLALLREMIQAEYSDYKNSDGTVKEPDWFPSIGSNMSTTTASANSEAKVQAVESSTTTEPEHIKVPLMEKSLVQEESSTTPELEQIKVPLMEKSLVQEESSTTTELEQIKLPLTENTPEQEENSSTTELQQIQVSLTENTVEQEESRTTSDLEKIDVPLVEKPFEQEGEAHGLLKLLKQPVGNTPKIGAIGIEEIKDMLSAGDESTAPTNSGEIAREKDIMESRAAKFDSTSKKCIVSTSSGENQREKDMVKSCTTKSPASIASLSKGNEKKEVKSYCVDNESTKSSKSIRRSGIDQQKKGGSSPRMEIPHCAPSDSSSGSSRDPIGHNASLGDSPEVSKKSFEWSEKKGKKSIAEFYDQGSISDSTIETRDIHCLEKDGNGDVRESIPEVDRHTSKGPKSIASRGSAFVATKTVEDIKEEEQSSGHDSSPSVESSSSSESSDDSNDEPKAPEYHNVFADRSMSKSPATRTSLQIKVEEPSRPHTRPEPLSIIQRVDDPISMSMEDADIDVRFVEQYEEFFQEFLYEKHRLLEREPELMGFLKVVKLQKILEASSEMEQNLQRKLEIIEHQKTFMSKAYHSQLMEASQAKARVELELELELEKAIHARKQMQAALTWKRIAATDARAKNQQRIMADLSQRNDHGEALMSFLPKLPETKLLDDCISTPPGGKIPEEVDKAVVHFQVDNALLQAESLILERHTQTLFEDAKKHAWVDAIFMQMKDEHLAKLKGLYASKMGGVAL